MTDYTFKKEDVDEKDKKKKEQESDEDRCKRLKRWKAAYKADKSKDKKVCLSLSFHRLSLPFTTVLLEGRGDQGAVLDHAGRGAHRLRSAPHKRTPPGAPPPSRYQPTQLAHPLTVPAHIPADRHPSHRQGC